jgi:hypothetical protein
VGRRDVTGSVNLVVRTPYGLVHRSTDHVRGTHLRHGVSYAVGTRYELAFGNTPYIGRRSLLSGTLRYEYWPYPKAEVWVLPLYYYCWLEHVSYEYKNKSNIIIARPLSVCMYVCMRVCMSFSGCRTAFSCRTTVPGKRTPGFV